jgi:hypothetical protein
MLIASRPATVGRLCSGGRRWVSFRRVRRLPTTVGDPEQAENSTVYEDESDFGENIDARFAPLFAKYQQSHDFVESLASRQDFFEEVDFFVAFSFYIAKIEGERAAIAFCERLHRRLLDADHDDHIGLVFLAQARFYDKLGKGMSRDLYAIEAAEAFAAHGELTAARKALSLVHA